MNRRQAREQAFSLLFEKTFHEAATLEEIVDSAQIARNFEVAPFAAGVFEGVNTHKEEIDEIISSHSKNWKNERLARAVLSILRLAIYEMRWEESIPKNVSINEAVELAKIYGTKEDAAFVNGVLSGVFKALEQTNE